MLQPQLLTDTLRQLSADTWGFISNPVAVLHAPVDPCTFLRQYVATNQPVLIQGATDHWPAAGLWDRQYLDSRVGAHEVSVELTPNGFGDAVTAYETDTGETGQCFCMPHTSRMPYREFTDLFFCSKQQQQQPGQQGSVIPYLSVSHGRLSAHLALCVELSGQCSSSRSRGSHPSLHALAHRQRLLCVCAPAATKQQPDT